MLERLVDLLGAESLGFGCAFVFTVLLLCGFGLPMPEDVVLVSEMQAGWYRYMSEWRLRSDGTIRPRFGFSAIDNPCTCNEHIHHVYWRFDFDIRTAWNNVVQALVES